jgi:hypothetical protein
MDAGRDRIRKSEAVARCLRHVGNASGSTRVAISEPLRMMLIMAPSRWDIPAPSPVWLNTKRNTDGKSSADGLEVPLELQIVGQIELANARGITAASQVLQQQRVVQLPLLTLGEPNLAANVHADPAAT